MGKRTGGCCAYPLELFWLTALSLRATLETQGVDVEAPIRERSRCCSTRVRRQSQDHAPVIERCDTREGQMQD